jgi:hypothetical protein
MSKVQPIFSDVFLQDGKPSILSLWSCFQWYSRVCFSVKELLIKTSKVKVKRLRSPLLCVKSIYDCWMITKTLCMWSCKDNCIKM